MTEHLIGQLGYLGITLILILGGLGLPIPEEAPIILAAILSRHGQMHWPLALASCLIGVLLGDLIVYFLGFFYGEKVLSLPLTRRLLTRQRETQIKGYFHRHGFKILLSGRFVPGFRTAAYLTAGILKLPTLKLIVIDGVAASLTTFLMFGLGYAFAHQIQSGIREAQQWATIALAVGIATWLYIRYEKARRRAGLPVGPPVLDSDDVPLPTPDHRSTSDAADIGTRRHPNAVGDSADTIESATGNAVAAAIPGSDPVDADERGTKLIVTSGPHEPILVKLEAGQPSSSIESTSR